jgi:hypothetical protein
MRLPQAVDNGDAPRLLATKQLAGRGVGSRGSPEQVAAARHRSLRSRGRQALPRRPRRCHSSPARRPTAAASGRRWVTAATTAATHRVPDAEGAADAARRRRPGEGDRRHDLPCGRRLRPRRRRHGQRCTLAPHPRAGAGDDPHRAWHGAHRRAVDRRHRRESRDRQRRRRAGRTPPAERGTVQPPGSRRPLVPVARGRRVGGGAVRARTARRTPPQRPRRHARRRCGLGRRHRRLRSRPADRGLPWCCIYVSYRLCKAGFDGFERGKFASYCGSVVAAARRRERHLALTKTPERGDLVIYNKDEHIEFFVEWVTPNESFRAVGGNTSGHDGSRSNGGEVAVNQRLVRDPRFPVSYFIRVGA